MLEAYGHWAGNVFKYATPAAIDWLIDWLVFYVSAVFQPFTRILYEFRIVAMNTHGETRSRWSKQTTCQDDMFQRHAEEYLV